MLVVAADEVDALGVRDLRRGENDRSQKKRTVGTCARNENRAVQSSTLPLFDHAGTVHPHQTAGAAVKDSQKVVNTPVLRGNEGHQPSSPRTRHPRGCTDQPVSFEPPFAPTGFPEATHCSSKANQVSQPSPHLECQQIRCPSRARTLSASKPGVSAA